MLISGAPGNVFHRYKEHCSNSSAEVRNVWASVPMCVPMEHNGTEKVEYGMRAAVESVRLQRACLRVVPPGPYEGAPDGGRGEVMSKEARKCRADYHTGCSPRKRVKCANQPGRRFSDRKRPVCRSVAEKGHPLAVKNVLAPQDGALLPSIVSANDWLSQPVVGFDQFPLVLPFFFGFYCSL